MSQSRSSRTIKSVVAGSLLLFPMFVFSHDLIENGDFEEPLEIGWEQDIQGMNFLIDRQIYYHPDGDYEARVEKTPYHSGSSSAALMQMVPLPSTDIEFSIHAKLYTYVNFYAAWTVAALMIEYYHTPDTLLGDTRIYSYTSECPWTSSPTSHLIEVQDTLWHTFSFNIGDELTNVPGVDPADVSHIEISLYTEAFECCGASARSTVTADDVMLSAAAVGENESSIDLPYETVIIHGSLSLSWDGDFRIITIAGRIADPTRLAPGIYFLEHNGKPRAKIIKIQ